MYIPTTLNDSMNVTKLANALNVHNVGKVRIVQHVNNSMMWDCHNNVIQYCRTALADHLLGYYFIVDANKVYAILHSVVFSYNEDNVLDITPFPDNRTYNVFGILCTNPVNIGKLRRCILMENGDINDLQYIDTIRPLL